MELRANFRCKKAAAILAMILPVLCAEEPAVRIDPKTIPEKEWELVKDQADYEVSSDSWFAEIERMSSASPKYSPGTGVGDAGAGRFASLVIRPETVSAGVRKWYRVEISYHSDPSPEGQTGHAVTRFKITEDTVSENIRRSRDKGLYSDPAMLKKVIAEILRQSHAIKKPERDREPNGKWNVEMTRSYQGGTRIDGELYQEVLALLGNPTAPGKPEDEEPWSWIRLYPRMDAPVTKRRLGTKVYRIGIYKDGRMKIFEESGDDPTKDFIMRDLGWFESPALWNRLRLAIASGSAAMREDRERK
jgi:hypothetical protein